jgi:hypothetical protein
LCCEICPLLCIGAVPDARVCASYLALLTFKEDIDLEEENFVCMTPLDLDLVKKIADFYGLQNALQKSLLSQDYANKCILHNSTNYGESGPTNW